MKLVALLTLSLCLSGAGSLFAKEQQTKAHTTHFSWLTDIEQAKREANKKSLPILLYFSGSDWCPHCKKLDKEVLSKPAFQDALQDKVIFVNIDFPKYKELDPKTKEQNSHLKKQFGISGFPTLLVVNSKLKLIGKPSRKSNPEDFAREVEKVLDGSAK